MLEKLLIANRGEVAIRVAQAAAELGIATVAVYSDDDARALHVQRATQAVALGAAGPAAYLDGARLIAIARDTGCAAVHPGYGFLRVSAARAPRRGPDRRRRQARGRAVRSRVHAAAPEPEADRDRAQPVAALGAARRADRRGVPARREIGLPEPGYDRVPDRARHRRRAD